MEIEIEDLTPEEEAARLVYQWACEDADRRYKEACSQLLKIRDAEMKANHAALKSAMARLASRERPLEKLVDTAYILTGRIWSKGNRE